MRPIHRALPLILSFSQWEKGPSNCAQSVQHASPLPLGRDRRPATRPRPACATGDENVRRRCNCSILPLIFRTGGGVLRVVWITDSSTGAIRRHSSPHSCSFVSCVSPATTRIFYRLAGRGRTWRAALHTVDPCPENEAHRRPRRASGGTGTPVSPLLVDGTDPRRLAGGRADLRTARAQDHGSCGNFPGRHRYRALNPGVSVQSSSR